MIAEFLLVVLYTQVTVAVPETPTAGLLWTDEHVAQGFAWSPGFVSFGVPDHDGQVRVTVDRPTAFEPSAETLWAVQVPFEVSGSSPQIGTVGSEHAVPVPTGVYNLVFEARRPAAEERAETAYDLRLHFIETRNPGFGILKQGDELETDRVLATSADPA